MTADFHHGTGPVIADIIASRFSFTSCQPVLGTPRGSSKEVRTALATIRLTTAGLGSVVVIGSRTNVSAAGWSTAGSHALAGTAGACRRALLHLVLPCILDRARPYVALARCPRSRLGLREGAACRDGQNA